jgi:cytochrome o ubiquinol oxidase subunit IV
MKSSATKEERDERKHYTIGLVLSVGMTILSFGAVISGLLPRYWAIVTIIVLAVAQIIVHLRIFLHIDLTKQRREDLQLLLFSLLLLGIMALGTLWIMADLQQRMI